MAEFIALHELLSSGRHADAAFAWRAGTHLGFADFASQAMAWRETFSQVEGEAVALYFEDTAAFASALFGAWHAGKHAVQPADVLPQTLKRLANLCVAVAGDFPETTPLPRLAATENPAITRWETLDPQRLALSVFTTGSTGEPVQVPKRIAQLTDEVRALETAFGQRLGDAGIFASVTHQHMYGLPFRLLWPLAAGRAFAAERWTFPEDIALGLAKVAPCVLIASPAHLKRLPNTLDWTGAKASLAAVFSAGGPLPDEALALCDAAFGLRPVEIYGSSETGAAAWRQRNTADVAWRALPGMEVSILGETLRLRASWLQADGTSDGWFDAADRVQALDEGFALLGRADRIVKIEEKRISLQAVERALMASGLLSEVRVLPLPGERVRLGVAAIPNASGWQHHDREGRKALIETLRHTLADSVEAIALPRLFRFLWQLPMNATGKTPESLLVPLFDPRRPAARLVERSAESATVRLDIAANSPFFDGHFPQAKILPGVAQLDLAIRFARELFNLPPDFAGAEGLKFHDWIAPSSTIELVLTRNADALVSFRIDSAKGRHAVGKLRFTSPKNPDQNPSRNPAP